MDNERLIKDLIKKTKSKIIMIVIDGLGDLGYDFKGTALEEALTPTLDKIASKSDLGLTIPIEIGITPGSGPAHLSLFGYDAINHNIGRGLLSALGLGFDVKPGDLCIRLNFCTLKDDVILDRRAGRISTEKNSIIVERLNKEIKVDGLELFFLTEKEHRAVLILRGKEFGDNLTDSDPQKDGEKILKIEGIDENSKKTAILLNEIDLKVRQLLQDSDVNGVIMRGYSLSQKLPSFQDKYELKAGAFSVYPMYKGLAKLVGMDVIHGINQNLDTYKALRSFYDTYDFFFVHFKDPDKYGEDGSSGEKTKSIESIDSVIEKIVTLLEFDVIIVCGDHSTPAPMHGHSWHYVPFMIKSKFSRKLTDAKRFTEKECQKGELGVFYAKYIMNLALAHADKLKKFGA